MKSAVAMGFPENLIAERRVGAHSSSNGEAERPRDGAQLEPRADTVFPRPRRHYLASRPPRRLLQDALARNRRISAYHISSPVAAPQKSA
jgi:hypothetical protein